MRQDAVGDWPGSGHSRTGLATHVASGWQHEGQHTVPLQFRQGHQGGARSGLCRPVCLDKTVAARVNERLTSPLSQGKRRI